MTATCTTSTCCPPKVAAQYPGSGIRPDLLFDFTAQGQESDSRARHAAGRRARPVRLVSQDQRDRLADIVAWSGVNGLHPVTMTYAYTGAANAQVDLFDITGSRLPGITLRITQSSPTRRAVLTREGRRFERLAFIRQRALGRVGEISDQLYATARKARRIRRGRPMAATFGAAGPPPT